MEGAKQQESLLMMSYTTHHDAPPDAVLKSLVSQVEDQKKSFDKKWQNLLSYLLTKEEDCERIQTKARIPSEEPANRVYSKRRSEVGGRRSSQLNQFRRKTLQFHEGQDFPSLAPINVKENSSPPIISMRKRHSRAGVKSLKENDAFLEEMREQLLLCKKIIEKERADKVKLVLKLKKLHLENISYKTQSSLPGVPLGNPAVNVKSQTEEQERSDVACNTSIREEDPLSESQKQVKVVYDQFEESRLRENISFWKEKVDLLLIEKKDALQEVMNHHKQVRHYENQLEDLKMQLKAKEEEIEFLQMEHKLLPQTPSLKQPDSMTSEVKQEDMIHKWAPNDSQNSDNAFLLSSENNSEIKPAPHSSEIESSQPSFNKYVHGSSQKKNVAGKIQKVSYLNPPTNFQLHRSVVESKKSHLHIERKSNPNKSINNEKNRSHQRTSTPVKPQVLSQQDDHEVEEIFSYQVSNSKNHQSNQALPREQSPLKSKAVNQHKMKSRNNLGLQKPSQSKSKTSRNRSIEKQPPSKQVNLYSESMLKKPQIINKVNAIQNQAMVEVLGRLNMGQEDEDISVGTSEQQPDNFLSPIAHAQSILQAFRLQAQPPVFQSKLPQKKEISKSFLVSYMDEKPRSSQHNQRTEDKQGSNAKTVRKTNLRPLGTLTSMTTQNSSRAFSGMAGKSE